MRERLRSLVFGGGGDDYDRLRPDVVVVACAPTVPYGLVLDVNAALRSMMTKEAEAMALTARTAAAAADGRAALFETAIGYASHVDENTGETREALVLLLPDGRGMEAALANVGGLLRRAVGVGRGRATRA